MACSDTHSFEIRDESSVNTLNKKELMLLLEAQSEYTVKLVETTQSSARWWRMEIVLSPQNKVYEVVTALGKIKTWKSLDIAIDFLKETCPSADLCVIHLKPS